MIGGPCSVGGNTYAAILEAVATSEMVSCSTDALLLSSSKVRGRVGCKSHRQSRVTAHGTIRLGPSVDLCSEA